MASRASLGQAPTDQPISHSEIPVLHMIASRTHNIFRIILVVIPILMQGAFPFSINNHELERSISEG